MINEEALRDHIRRSCENAGVKDGYALIYLDGGKVEFIGNISLDVLAPRLLSVLTKRLVK